MHEGYFPGEQIGENDRRSRRVSLESEVQNLCGPIKDIETLSDSVLTGIRDSFRNAQKRGAEEVDIDRHKS